MRSSAGDRTPAERSFPTPGLYEQFSLGRAHGCGVLVGGAVACWGTDFGPPPAGSFQTVSAGDSHTCGTLVDDTAVCWGIDTSGSTAAVPGGLFKQVDVGNFHSCGLRYNGAINCWGQNDAGQISSPSDAFLSVSAGGIGFAVGAGGHTCGVRDGGAIVCWGHSGAGQTDTPWDADSDSVADVDDNCPVTPNGALLGTCTSSEPGTFGGVCTSDTDCDLGETCSLAQEDSDGLRHRATAPATSATSARMWWTRCSSISTTTAWVTSATTCESVKNGPGQAPEGGLLCSDPVDGICVGNQINTGDGEDGDACQPASIQIVSSGGGGGSGGGGSSAHASWDLSLACGGDPIQNVALGLVFPGTVSAGDIGFGGLCDPPASCGCEGPTGSGGQGCVNADVAALGATVAMTTDSFVLGARPRGPSQPECLLLQHARCGRGRRASAVRRKPDSPPRHAQGVEHRRRGHLHRPSLPRVSKTSAPACRRLSPMTGADGEEIGAGSIELVSGSLSPELTLAIGPHASDPELFVIRLIANFQVKTVRFGITGVAGLSPSDFFLAGCTTPSTTNGQADLFVDRDESNHLGQHGRRSRRGVGEHVHARARPGDRLGRHALRPSSPESGSLERGSH